MNFISTRRRLMLAAALTLSTATLTLTGCSTLSGTGTVDVERFSGRFSGKFIRSGKSETLSGRYRCTQTPEDLTLELMTPLYGVLARVVVNEKGACLYKENEVLTCSASAEELMQKTVGFGLPVEMLDAWLKGRPSDKIASTRVSTNTFEQASWRIRILRFHPSGKPAVLELQALDPVFAGTRMNLTIEEAQP